MRFDIVVIGGGIIGSSAAYWLSREGCGGTIAVIEPDPTYSRASTPQGAGGVRRLFSRPENIAMSQFSLDFYQNFHEMTGLSEADASIQFRKQGYLFVVGPNGAESLAKNHGFQKSMGVPAELLDREALKQKFPSLRLDDIAIGCHSPEDGWIDPSGALRGFRLAAERNGVTYVKARAANFETYGRRITSATLEDGRTIEGRFFLNTAGPWCTDIAAMIGADLPVKPMCRVQHYWLCASEVEPMPLVKDESGLFFRPEGDGFVGGCPSFEIEPGFILDVDRGHFANYFEETVWPLAASRCHKFEAIRLQTQWGGHYAQNLFDGNMIIGPFSADHDNIITACGFSGHGLMHAPAVGRALSELALNGRHQTLDLGALGIERVRNDRPYHEIGIK